MKKVRPSKQVSSALSLSGHNAVMKTAVYFFQSHVSGYDKVDVVAA